MAKRKKWGSPAQRAALKKMQRARKKRGAHRSRQSVTRYDRPVSQRAWRTSGSRRKRNPFARGAGGLKNVMRGTVLPAVTAASGAVLLDVAWSYLPIPDAVKVGPMRHVAKGAGAIALGMVAGLAVKQDTAKQFAAGALTVVLYNAIREVAARFVPQIALGEYLSEAAPGDVYDAASTEENTISAYLEGTGDYSLGETYDLNGVGEAVETY